MKDIIFGEKYDAPLAIALGFFDCIHRGHMQLIQEAVDFAKHNGNKSAVMTFSNDPSSLLGGGRQIYSYSDRRTVLDGLQVDNVISATFDSDFAKLSAEEFLDILFGSLDIRAVFVGDDYTFGSGGEGDVDLLKSECALRGIPLFDLPFYMQDGVKVSTRQLKPLVISGDIKSLNTYLARPYFMCGTVVEGRHIGKSLGFPTANMRMPIDRLPLADGVYHTTCNIDGKTYDGITNIGARPTFDEAESAVETHIIGYDGNLYGATLKISFVRRLRDIVRFDSPKALISQLKMDVESALKDSE